MGTTYFLRADLILEPARHATWLAMPLEGIATPTGGWGGDGPVELSSAADVLSSLADAADHFSYVADGERVALHAFFSHDWLIEQGPALARTLAAFAIAGGSGSAVLADAATGRGAVTALTPGKPPKTGAMRAGAIDATSLAAASQAPPTAFAAPSARSAARPTVTKSALAKPATRPAAKATKSAAKATKPAAKPAKKASRGR